ncbi:hypothetical protein AB0M87_32120 [Streptomyces sp. NPDC051320]|uniref:hypothetical protein n=1 Tax=Streptomyces sp. NPDC051320 TaxID=3154644 RepID=UPI0034452CE6
MEQPENEASNTPTAHTSMSDRAKSAVTRLIMSLGSGEHIIVLAHEGSMAAAHVEIMELDALGAAACDAGELDALTALLAKSFTGALGGLVVRSRRGPGAEEEIVRGWRVRGRWLSPITEGEVFSAYCTHHETGEPISPEPNVTYRAGITLPQPARDA